MIKPNIFLLGLLLALSGSFLPYFLIMVAGRYVEASRTGIIVLVEPVGAIIFGVILLKEPITLAYIFGGSAILIAVCISAFGKRKNNGSKSNNSSN